MKKFISMVMATAMVVSLVPATAFAANTATFKLVNAQDYTEAEAKTHDSITSGDTVIAGPEVQLKLKDVDSKQGEVDDYEVTLDFDNAELSAPLAAAQVTKTTTDGKDVSATVTGDAVGYVVGKKDAVKVYVKEKAAKGDDSVKLIVQELNKDLEDDDVIAIDLEKLGLILTKTSKNTKATVEVGGDFGDSDAMTFASVLDTGIKVSLKKVAEVAEEETTNLEKDLKIEAAVGKFVKGQKFELKLNSGFEFTDVAKTAADGSYSITKGDDDNKIIVTVNGAVATGAEVTDTITIDSKDITIDAVSAKVGAVAKITVKAIASDVVKTDASGNYLDKDGKVTTDPKQYVYVTVGFKDTADAVEAAKVVADELKVTVDKDEDVPVIYSGVDADNTGITDDSDHKALEVTIEEPVKDTLDVKKELTLELPEGVYATDVEIGQNDFGTGANKAAFATAYDKGDFETFKFARRTLTSTANASKEGKLEFTLKLVAEPGFTGDVTLKVNGGGLDKAKEVVIAKFVAPYTVEAAQNDLIIDYRNTKVPTNIVVKEAEAGLWKKNSEFVFGIDKFDKADLENDATYKADDKSEMEVKKIKNVLGFKVDEESADAAAAVTISDISLYMSRNKAAGAYDLTLDTTGSDAFMAQHVLGAVDKASTKEDEREVRSNYYDNDPQFGQTVKEGFINIITAGRDQDDASFTKKVVVPVGEKYLIAGEEQVALDVPAYISAAGYTMLPVRAVATALGINNNNVLWNQASRTVTILYGQRIITMVAGQKVVTVNGNTIPASATVQIKDGRTFLPMRDLATALGVTDITWDAATKTATMNGNQNK